MSDNTNISVDDVVVSSVAEFVRSNTNWTGTMTQLRNKISRLVGRSNRNYVPGSPSALRKVVDRNIRRIRKRGVSVRFARTPDKARTRLVTLLIKQ